MTGLTAFFAPGKCVQGCRRSLGFFQTRKTSKKTMVPHLFTRYCCNGNLNDLLVRCGRPGLGEGLVRRLLAEVRSGERGLGFHENLKLDFHKVL